jgi:hypothetical protein
MVKRIPLALGILFGLLVLFAVTTIWEPHSAQVRAYQFAGIALLPCISPIWYVSRRPGN